MRGTVVAIVLCAYCLMATQAQTVTIGGRTYVQVDSTWYWIDCDSASWEIAPGRIIVEFNSGVSAAQRDTFADDHDLTESPLIVPTGFLYTYDPERDPIVVLDSCFASTVVISGYPGGNYAGINVILDGAALIKSSTIEDSDNFGARAAKGARVYLREVGDIRHTT